MDFISSAPYTFPKHRETQAQVMDKWLIGLKASEMQKKRVLSLLGETYLMSVPITWKSLPWPKFPIVRNFYYHLRAQVSKVLGYKDCTPFPPFIDNLIWNQLWPDVIPNDNQRGKSDGCCNKVGLP